MTQEALKLALEALELNNSEWKDLADSGDSGYWKAEDQGHYQLTIEAITAIKEALAHIATEREAAKNEERADCAALCKEIAKESDSFTRDILLMVAGLIEARGRDPMPLFSDWPGGFK